MYKNPLCFLLVFRQKASCGVGILAVFCRAGGFPDEEAQTGMYKGVDSVGVAAVFGQLFRLFIPVGVGYILTKRQVCHIDFARELSVFLYYVTLPCAVISAMQIDLNPHILSEVAAVLAASVISVAVSFPVAVVFCRVAGVEGIKKGVLSFSLVFSNFSFMGYPVAEAFMGEKGLFFATVFSLPLYFFVQSVGLSFLKGGEKGLKARHFINPPMVGVYTGFLLFLTGLRLSGPVSDVVEAFGDMTTPLSMVLVGMTLGTVPLKKIFGGKKFYAMAAFRLVIIPLLLYGLLSLFGFDREACRITATVTMMPVAANIIITLSRHGADTVWGAKAVFITCLLSFFSIPVLWLLLF